MNGGPTHPRFPNLDKKKKKKKKNTDTNPNTPARSLTLSMASSSSSSRSETLDLEPSLSKRLKIQSQLGPSPISPSSKGKTPISHLSDDALAADDDADSSVDEDPLPPRSCGICLSDEGTSIRGCIDCCDHYYCFVCIIEWSKIESRCPFCKCRFHSIRRMRRDGSSIGDRAVEVPIRDQIPDPLGVPLAEARDARVRCSVCGGTSDESFLIPCDLCGTVGHTYCIGLGATVPEGDWYCRDCEIVQAEQRDDEVGNSAPCSGIAGVPPTTESRVSVFDIVAEPREADKIQRLLALVSPSQRRLFTAARQESSVATTSLDSRLESDVGMSCRCENGHKCIRALRENWASYQRGTLCFSSIMLDSDGRSSMMAEAADVDGSHDRGSLPFRSSQVGNIVCNKDKRGYDVNKAWKMFDAAKSMRQAKKQHQTPGPASKIPPTKSRKDLDSTSIQMHLLLDNTNGWSKCQGPQRKNHYSRRSVEVNAPRNGGPLSSRKLQSSFPKDERCHNARLVSDVEQSKITPNVCNGRDELPCSSTVVVPMVRVPCNGSKLERNSLPSSDAECYGSVVAVDNTSANINSRNVCVAKSEIQSLVKLNLKMLTRDKQIGVDAFKDIAKQSTHVILAACGLQHSETGESPLMPSICSHRGGNQELPMSTLMPGSCRECFYTFVMGVVNSALTEKLGCR